MIKLIASDVDGTLVPDGTDRIDPGIFDAIQRMKKHGIAFAAASGRQYASLRNLFSPVQDDICYITDNGGFLRDHAGVYMKNSIDRELLFALIEDAKKLPGCDIMLCGLDWAYCEEERYMYHWMKDSYKYNIKAIGDFKENLKDDIVKLSIYHPTDCENVVNEWLTPKWSGKFKIASAGIQWMDCISPSADKGTALRMLMDKLGVRREETMVFGDNLNDIEMLLCAEESYAIGNAREEVKKAAKHVADLREHQGVLKAVTAYLDSIERV